jgi:hypothetical protein
VHDRSDVLKHIVAGKASPVAKGTRGLVDESYNLQACVLIRFARYFTIPTERINAEHVTTHIKLCCAPCMPK